MLQNWYDLPKDKFYDDLNTEETLFYFSLSVFDRLKFLLRNDESHIDGITSVDTYLNYPDKILLQLYGYQIVLKDDGTWEWEDTTG